MSCSPVLMNDTLQNFLEGGDRGELQEGEGGVDEEEAFWIAAESSTNEGGGEKLELLRGLIPKMGGEQVLSGEEGGGGGTEEEANVGGESQIRISCSDTLQSKISSTSVFTTDTLNFLESRISCSDALQSKISSTPEF